MAGLLSAAIVAALGIMLLDAFDVRILPALPDRETLVALLPEQPPPPAPTRIRAASHKVGAAAPLHLRSQATPVVAPMPEIVLPTPPPVAVAPLAGRGVAPLAGAADRAGPGSGAGGQGNGLGAGGAGSGDGGGTDSVQIAGRIKDSDYPRAAVEAGVSGVVYLRFTVGVNGRVTTCAVTRSSGSAELDETTCRLIVKRFRYRPATDASGRPVTDEIAGEHRWFAADEQE